MVYNAQLAGGGAPGRTMPTESSDERRRLCLRATVVLTTGGTLCARSCAILWRGTRVPQTSRYRTSYAISAVGQRHVSVFFFFFISAAFNWRPMITRKSITGKNEGEHANGACHFETKKLRLSLYTFLSIWKWNTQKCVERKSQWTDNNSRFTPEYPRYSNVAISTRDQHIEPWNLPRCSREQYTHILRSITNVVLTKSRFLSSFLYKTAVHIIPYKRNSRGIRNNRLARDVKS